MPSIVVMHPVYALPSGKSRARRRHNDHHRFVFSNVIPELFTAGCRKQVVASDQVEVLSSDCVIASEQYLGSACVAAEKLNDIDLSIESSCLRLREKSIDVVTHRCVTYDGRVDFAAK